MPSFVNSTERYILTTSMKVMFTSLTRQPGLRPIRFKTAVLLRLALDGRIRHYMLTRNPYDRLVSFYLNKVAAPDRASIDRYGWQRCQRIHFPRIGVSGDERVEVILAQMRSTTFDQFVRWLPETHLLDPHLHPQTENIRARFARVTIPLRVNRYVPMETGLEFARDELRLDVSIRWNSSRHGAYQAYFTVAEYAIVNRIYAEDFDRLGYQCEPDGTGLGRRRDPGGGG